jgi:hypothetical protein
MRSVGHADDDAASSDRVGNEGLIRRRGRPRVLGHASHRRGQTRLAQRYVLGLPLRGKQAPPRVAIETPELDEMRAYWLRIRTCSLAHIGAIALALLHPRPNSRPRRGGFRFAPKPEGPGDRGPPAWVGAVKVALTASIARRLDEFMLAGGRST